MMNPNIIFQMKSAWDTFVNNHPKFPLFLKAAANKGITAGTIIEINITTSQGEILSTNVKVTESDMELFRNIQELSKGV